jgi:hypothetical protein
MFWNTLRLLDLWSIKRSRVTFRVDLGASVDFANLGVVSFWILGLLAIVGAFTSMARRIPRALWLVPLLFWVSEAPVNVATPRFRAAIDPFVILLASCALAIAWEWLLLRRHVANPRLRFAQSETRGSDVSMVALVRRLPALSGVLGRAR